MIRLLKQNFRRIRRRRGITLPLVAVLTVVLIGLLAFAVDLGYISLVRGQMQSAADSAALAAASQLLDRDWLSGENSQSLADADAQAGRFAAANRAGGISLTLGSGDVRYGYIAQPQDPNSPFDQGRSPFNSAQVTVQRTDGRNGEVGLFFAKIFNRNSLPLQATATATYEGAIRGFEFSEGDPDQKSLLLPFSLDRNIWLTAVRDGSGPDHWSYDRDTGAVTAGAGDTIREVKLYPTKNLTPGNFGTIDIGTADNSSSDIARQILDGPTPDDFKALAGGMMLGENGTLILNGDTGISAGFKDELQSIVGQPRIISLHESVTGNGNNAEFTIVQFCGCVILDVQLTGGDKYLLIQPEFAIDPTAVGGGTESDHSFVYKPLKLSR